MLRFNRQMFDEVTKDGGQSMRKLNRMIAAGALAVPMALGASGIAVADVVEDSSGVQNQVMALEGNSSDEGDFGRSEIGEDLRDAFGVGDDEGSNEGNSEEDGILEFLEEIFGDENNSTGDNSLLG